MRRTVEMFAEEFARKAHAGQLRKGKNIPFITHLERAVEIAKEITDDENIIAGTWLHDTVEDTKITLEDIRENFNAEIYHYICLETEKKDNTPESSWRRRKETQLRELEKHKEDNVIIITFSDKLANLTEILEDYTIHGEEFFQIFNNKNKNDHCWYYSSFLKIFKESGKIPQHLIKRYEDNLNKVFIHVE